METNINIRDTMIVEKERKSEEDAFLIEARILYTVIAISSSVVAYILLAPCCSVI